MKGIVYFMFLCMCCACRYGDTAVEEALMLAGKNRGELEAVLEYYREDSLKTKAAEFLIGNMPGHYSFADTVSVNRYYDAVDAVLDSLSGRPMEEVKGTLERLPFRMDGIDYGKVEDVETVTADYLIRHIDTAFVRWKHGAWARHLDFDEFCEYLLPYKMEEFQYLDGWRDYLWEDYRGELDGLKYSDLYWNSALQASLIANNSLKRRLHPHFIESAIVPVYRLRTRMRLPCGVCDDYSNITVSVMRSLGIPVACDFTPHWPVRASGHTWNVVKGNNGNNLTFGGADTNPDQPHNFDEKKSKILPEQKGMFFVQSFFELFEVLLSYLSNTLSFLRIGAFAVSHAAMMEVVLMLAGATNGGNPNWIVVVLGNIFVCAMEGLIVGIQVLRLEYYEIFSRFYAGNGREFQPFMKTLRKSAQK